MVDSLRVHCSSNKVERASVVCNGMGWDGINPLEYSAYDVQYQVFPRLSVKRWREILCTGPFNRKFTMQSALKFYCGIFIFSILSACTSYIPHPDDCIGSVISPPDGLVKTTDNELLTLAIGVPTKGSLCKGQVFSTEKEVTVFRVWDKLNPIPLYGNWWSFLSPIGPREKYQVDNIICPEWNALNKMSSCTIKVGAKIVVGPGQSAKCSDGGLLPSTAVNQIYIPNDVKKNVLFVENCSTGVDWPGPPE